MVLSIPRSLSSGPRLLISLPPVSAAYSSDRAIGLIPELDPSADRPQRLLLSVSGMSSGHDYTQIMSAEGTLAIEKTRCA
jgi:hypothetical protein